MQRGGSDGFTLIEVTLATVVGIVLIAGGTALYTQAQQQAGNSRAKAKAISLQGVVEELAARSGGAYPTSQLLYTQWILDRADAALSPWGGPAADGMDGSPFQAQGFIGGDAIPAAVRGANPWGSNPHRAGCIQYDRIVDSTTGSNFDTASQLAVPYAGYWVNICGTGGDQFYFVQGGR